MKLKKLIVYYFLLIITFLSNSCKEDVLDKNTYTYYTTAKVNEKRFLFPMRNYDSNSNTLYKDNFLRLHMGNESEKLGVEIIIFGIRLDTLKLPAKIPKGNFSISLLDNTIVKPNNEQCQKSNLDCHYVANDTSNDVTIIVEKFSANLLEGTYFGNFHAYGFTYFIVNDLNDKVKVTDGYFKGIYKRQ